MNLRICICILILVENWCFNKSLAFNLTPQPPKSLYRGRKKFLLLSGGCVSSLVCASSNTPNNDTRGSSSLLLDDVTVYRGPARILTDVKWRVEPKSKWALVGANGSGKSTLLKAIVGEIQFEGNIHLGTSDIGYLQQTAVSGSTRTIYDEASSAMKHIEEARQALHHAQEQLERVSADNSGAPVADYLVKAHDRAMRNFEAVGGYTQEQKVANVLRGLGFNDLNKRCHELSGGWQMRVSFAKLLLSEPSLCLMDEPGNHLDASARKWLANYLAKYDGDGTLILVTHDVSLLSSMDHIAEVTSGTLQLYKSCTYQQYLQLKKQRSEAAQVEYERNQKKAARLQGFVDRFGASATKASAAQSRVKQLERMQKEGLLDKPSGAMTQKRFLPILRFPDPPAVIGETLLTLRNAEVGYEQEKPLVSNINLKINRGMKLLIRGANGAGKSTILHSLRGSLPLIQGDRIENSSLRLGVFTQDLAQQLDKDALAVDLVTSNVREEFDITISDQDARSAMGRLGLEGDKPLRQLKALSGGEKARVALAIFSLKPSNLYLLDEVSNHLDVECVGALGDALSEWGNDTGAIVVISHDRVFCEKIGFTHVATVRDGTLAVEERDAVEIDWTAISSMSNPSEPEVDTDKKQTDRVKVDSKLRKQVFNAPKRIAKLETLIEKIEIEIAEIDEEMLACGTDVQQLVDLTARKEKLEENVMEHMEEWQELEELLAKVS